MYAYLNFLPCLGVGGLQVEGVEAEVAGDRAGLDLVELTCYITYIFMYMISIVWVLGEGGGRGVHT